MGGDHLQGGSNGFRSDDTATARNILQKYGHSEFDYFKVWNDKSYFFSETRESFLSYRVEWGTAVCLDDSVGPEPEQKDLFSRFTLYCRKKGLRLVVLFPDNLPLYTKIGLHLLKVGEEGVVDLKHFSEVVSRQKYFRHIRRAITNSGYYVERYKPPLSSSIVDEAEQISTEWLKLRGHREFGFAQGTFNRNYLAQTAISVLRDRQGRAVAFINEVPSYRPGEAMFDMTRNIPEVPHGAMDYIFSGLMQALYQEGYKTFAMGVVPFAGVGETPGSGLVDRGLHQLMHFNWLVHAKGLRLFKIKFEPYWEDRYVAYQGGRLALVRIGLAISRAVERVN